MPDLERTLNVPHDPRFGLVAADARGEGVPLELRGSEVLEDQRVESVPAVALTSVIPPGA